MKYLLLQVYIIFKYFVFMFILALNYLIIYIYIIALMSLLHYQINQIIGRGITSNVYIAYSKLKGVNVALKFIKQKSKSILQFIKHEKQILQRIDSNHVVKLIQSFEENNQLILVLQYCNGGNLNEYIQSKINKKLDESEAILFTEQIISAFTALYKINCLHRDIKPQNILLHNGYIKIADFGGSICLKNQDQLRQTHFGSKEYLSPQRKRELGYGHKADIWSLGCIFFRMLTGSYYEQELGKKVFEQFTNLRIKQFLCKTLEPNPDYRISWPALFNYKFSYKSVIPPYIPIYHPIKIPQDVISILPYQLQLPSQSVIVQKQGLDKLLILNQIRTSYDEELDSILFPLKYLCYSIQILEKVNFNVRVYFICIIKCILTKVREFWDGLKKQKNWLDLQHFELFLKSNVYNQTVKNVEDILQQLEINLNVHMNSLNEIIKSGLRQFQSYLLNTSVHKEFLMDFYYKIDIEIFQKYNDQIRMLLSKLIILRLVNQQKISKHAYEQEFDNLGCYKIQNLKIIVDKYEKDLFNRIYDK